MRTTLTLADDVYEAAGILAEASGRSPGEVLSDLARRGLGPGPAVGFSSAGPHPPEPRAAG